MKTFNDLQFEAHPISIGADKLPFSLRKDYENAKQATMDFDNGYGVSVLIGGCFYSNGVDTYEVAVMKNGAICYDTPITDDVIGRITSDEVTEIMKQVQKLQHNE